MSGYNGPRPIEIYRLPEQANAQIPADVREQFQRDENGNILFFTTPPVDVLPPVGEGTVTGHTARYLANKLRRKITLKETRSAEDIDEPAAKKAKLKQEEQPSQQRVEELRDKGLKMLIEQMNKGTEDIYKGIYGIEWEKGMREEQGRLRKRQGEERARREDLERSRRERAERERVDMYGSGVFLDDWNPRY